MQHRRGLCVFFCLIGITSLQLISAQSRDAHRDCPKKSALIGNRKCLKSCNRDTTCRGHRRKCMCDDVCGMSCVNPNSKCNHLEPIPNAHDIKITPYSKFNAVANYTCVPGFILQGHGSRTCVGDGSWTGTEPICVFSTFSCSRPPDIENAIYDRRSGPYPVGTTVQYYCRRGYEPHGDRTATCGQAAWNGPKMKCAPKSCGHPGNVPNGNRVGDLFFYPHRVDYRCSTGYTLVGTSYRICQEDGRWSRELPFCTPIQCPELYKPQHGTVFGHSISYQSDMEFRCDPGYRLIGTNRRTCLANGTWSGQPAHCDLIDCGMPEFYNGVVEGAATTLGAHILFRCSQGTTLEGSSTTAECLITGEWSHPAPKCWRKCLSPEIPHGSVASRNQKAEHSMPLIYSCTKGYVKGPTLLSTCNNGSWSPQPKCIPAPCLDRPPIVKNGDYRYVSSNHGDKVRYECKIGYTVMNDEYLLCKFGNWSGLTPWCKPMLCEYPGDVKHGKILLVGAKGKYLYHSHVPNIGQGQQIEFHCAKDYTRMGARRSTCINGHWFPRPNPRRKCARGTHVNLPFRFKFVRMYK